MQNLSFYHSGQNDFNENDLYARPINDNCRA